MSGIVCEDGKAHQHMVSARDVSVKRIERVYFCECGWNSSSGIVDEDAPQFVSRLNDLCTSLTINNVLQSDVGRLLDMVREAGFDVEINVSRNP